MPFACHIMVISVYAMHTRAHARTNARSRVCATRAHTRARMPFVRAHVCVPHEHTHALACKCLWCSIRVAHTRARLQGPLVLYRARCARLHPRGSDADGRPGVQRLKWRVEAADWQGGTWNRRCADSAARPRCVCLLSPQDCVQVAGGL